MELKEIPGFDGYYGITVDGRVWNYLSKRFLKPTIGIHGYYRVGLYKDRIQKGYLIHRLILAGWSSLGLDDKHTVVHHVNGDPLDNRLENLQIMTNSKHSGNHNHINAKGYGINTETHKLCTKCGILKLRSEFNISRNNLDGLCDQCRSCNKEYRKNYYQQNKEAILQRKRR